MHLLNCGKNNERKSDKCSIVENVYYMFIFPSFLVRCWSVSGHPLFRAWSFFDLSHLQQDGTRCQKLPPSQSKTLQWLNCKKKTSILKHLYVYLGMYIISLYWQKSPTCVLCGMQGHTQRDCPGRPCTNCGLSSHNPNPCKVPPVWNQHCQRCGMTGHLSDVRSPISSHIKLLCVFV